MEGVYASAIQSQDVDQHIQLKDLRLLDPEHLPSE